MFASPNQPNRYTVETMRNLNEHSSIQHTHAYTTMGDSKHSFHELTKSPTFTSPVAKRKRFAAAGMPNSIPLNMANWYKFGSDVHRDIAKGLGNTSEQSNVSNDPFSPTPVALSMGFTNSKNALSMATTYHQNHSLMPIAGSSTSSAMPQRTSPNNRGFPANLPYNSDNALLGMYQDYGINDTYNKNHVQQQPSFIPTLNQPSPKMYPHHVQVQSQPLTEDELSNDETSGSNDSELKFRIYQAENWMEKYDELCEFRRIYGHCLVPNVFPENPPLAQWVKRQRYQYKLKCNNKRSSMSDERIQALEQVGFVWDSHSAVWDERLEELLEFRQVMGHCNVPSRYTGNHQLAVWVKRQRRQYKFYLENKPSAMTLDRIHRLEAIGFEWDMRKSKGQESDEEGGSNSSLVV